MKREDEELLSKDVLDKVQFVLCGYDLRGSVTEISANGETKTRALRPEESVWFEYEKNNKKLEFCPKCGGELVKFNNPYPYADKVCHTCRLAFVTHEE